MERNEFGHKFEDWAGIDPITGATIMGWRSAEGNPPVVVTPPAHLHNAWRVWVPLSEKPLSFTGEQSENAAFSHAVALTGQQDSRPQTQLQSQNS